ncbi:helix-turn-helix transcriptional regulator [Catenulispora pinisilvae]|uniref:helix-turn-helix transcriptional regulator n=1 Tax=Catenulispora pinisilvae TaxID=2705253 RepID=UPI001892005F|nr:helix-turn-helix transcriptional regulator [Catenulispora pinisilvae]
MALCADYAAERTFRRIVAGLRSARLEAGTSQNALSVGLPVRGRAISEWETGAIEPTLGHLILWSRALGRRLVIVGRDGNLRVGPSRPRPGELWEIFERRRLAVPLRNRRLALGMGQGELGRLVGVSRDSIQRWELVRVPPRPIAHVVWAQRLGYTLDVWPIAPTTADGAGRLRGQGPGVFRSRPGLRWL